VIIEHWHSGIFVIPLILHVTTAAMMVTLLILAPAEQQVATAHLEPERGLVESRTLALWLSRIALPAMYVVNFALGAIFPTLPLVRPLSPKTQTLIGSVWIVARMIGFAILGATAFWHTRPRLLLVSSVGLLAAFLIATLAPTLAMMIAAQILLGAAMAMIYTGSLYFGMVLSKGSTEHGGYHEALIGLGGVLGPGAGAISQYFWPGDVRMAVAAVSGIVAISVIGAAGASLRLRDPHTAEVANQQSASA
jgi:MFS family permease